MRNISYYILCVLFLMFNSCKNEETYRDVILISGTEGDPVKKLTVEEAPAEIGIRAGSTGITINDISLSFKTSPSLVEKFNKERETNHKILPEGSYELSSLQSTIKKGEHVSSPISFKIISVDNFEEGATYLMPVSIDKVEGGLSVLESSRTVYIVINKTIITHVADLNLGSTYFRVDFTKDPKLKSVPQVSYEARIYVKDFQENSPYISSIIGIEETLLLRLGDVTIDKEQLQFCGPGGAVTAPNPLEKDRWYHVASVYDGQTMSVYIDGELAASKEASGSPIDLTNQWMDGFHIAYSERGRTLNGMVSECRLWTKALTQMEIKNNMCYVDPKSEGLLAYWRINEGEGNTVTDHTGNGYNPNTFGAINWVEGVKCP